MRNIFTLLLIFCALLAAQIAFGDDKSLSSTPEIVLKSRDLSSRGEFAAAVEMLNKELEKKELTPEVNKEIYWEIERLRRTKLDYNMTEEDLFKELSDAMSNVTREEMAAWIGQGLFDKLKIDGATYFVGASVSNLFFTRPELRNRRKDTAYVQEQTDFGKKILEHSREVKKAALENNTSLVLPIMVEGDMTITPKKEFVPEGKLVRCWMPYPTIFYRQPEVFFISSSQRPSWIAHPQSPIRCAYFEKTSVKDEAISFNIKYEYKSYACYVDVNPDLVIPYKNGSEANLYLSEEPPNILFLPELKQLSVEIVREEKNPYLAAKSIYKWVTDNIMYSYAREYSTLINIPQIIYERKAGDCGMEALLFITLCRINGIAARWQSGWEFMSGKTGMHDWAEIFIEPYGWIPVDPYMGIFAISGEHNLEPKDKEDIRNFYFGGIDHFRFVANKGNNQILYPPKNSFRSETVDFQRGEVEVENTNLYFGQFKCQMKLTEKAK